MAMAEAMTGRSVGSLLVAAIFVGACSGTGPAQTATSVAPTQSVAGTSSAAPASVVASSPTAEPTAEPTPVATPVDVSDAAWVVQRRLSHNTAIEVLGSDGSDLVSVAGLAMGSYPTNPDWSPDGQRITFVITDDSGRDDLWVVNVDGSDPKWLYDCVGTCANLDDPAWAPDGKSIAACKNSHDANHPSDLVAVDVETGAETILFTPGLNQFCAGPRWSPDGSQIVLEIVATAGAAVDTQVTGVVLSIVDLSARFPAARGLTKPTEFAATADWSRETNLIVFNRRVEEGRDPNDVYTINPDGTGLTRVTYLADDGSGAFEPSFDATGSTVVFHSNGVLWQVDLASGEVTLAFGRRVEGNHPRVRPAP